MSRVDEQLPAVDSDGVPIIIAAAIDPRLRRAAERACNRLPELLAALRSEDPKVQCDVKAAFPRVGASGHKHMWVHVTSVQDGVFVGELANDPQGKVAHQAGDTVLVDFDSVEDWMVHRGGKKYTGGFSLPVLDQIERERRSARRIGPTELRPSGSSAQVSETDVRP